MLKILTFKHIYLDTTIVGAAMLLICFMACFCLCRFFLNISPTANLEFFFTRAYSVGTCPHTRNKETVSSPSVGLLGEHCSLSLRKALECLMTDPHKRRNDRKINCSYLNFRHVWAKMITSFYCEEQKGHSILILVKIQPWVIKYKYLNQLLKPLELTQAHKY